jgi:Zn-finger nucleic acid-binding protein
MRLVACPRCHAQYDVTTLAAPAFSCRCGERLSSQPPQPVDAAIHRCGSCGALAAPEVASCAFCGSALVREARALSLICPECYARCAEDARFCTACGVAFRPEPVPPEGEPLACPACGEPMPARRVAGVGVHECPGCRGLFAPGESFDRLVARATEARRSADPVQLAALAPRVRGGNPAARRVEYRRCPVCSRQMQRRNFRRSSGVILDICGSCGTWLDADELEAIAGFLLSGGETKAALLEEARSAEREAARLARARQRERGPLEAGVGARGAGSLLELLLGLGD